MQVLMSWSGGKFDPVGYAKRWLVETSTMVRSEVKTFQGNLLKKLK